jgi:hypothetical protein
MLQVQKTYLYLLPNFHKLLFMLLKWIFKNKIFIQRLNLKNVEPKKYHNMCIIHLQLSYEMFVQWHFLGCFCLWHFTIDALLQKPN